MNSKIVLKGSLAFLNLGELLQLLGMSGSNGVIKLISNHKPGAGYIYLTDGNPVDAEFQAQKGPDVLNAFFGWVDADFEFSEEQVLRRRTIQKNRMEIILDGLRMVDDGEVPRIGEAGPHKSKTGARDETGVPVIKGPLVDYLYIVDEDEFLDGQEIVVESKFGNWLWVILDGTAAVTRFTPEGDVIINKLTDGAFIGSLCSLKEKTNVRSATVTAIGNVQLGVMDFNRILEEFIKVSEPLQHIIFSMENRLKQLTDLCAAANFKKFRIFKDMGTLQPVPGIDDAGRLIYQITSGKAAVVKPLNGRFAELSILTPGDIIGNVPFLDTPHEPHSAMVYGSEGINTKELDLIDLKEEYDTLSQTLKNMMQHTSTCLSVTTGRLMDMIKKSKE